MPMEDIVYGMECDRDIAGTRYERTYMTLGKDRLAIVRYTHIETPGTVASDEPAVPSVDTVPLSEVEKLSVVSLVASGLIVMKERTSGAERIVAALTNQRMKQAAKFVSLFEKSKTNETISSEEAIDAAREDSCPTCGTLYPNKDRAFCPKCMKKRAIFVRLLSFATQYKKSIGFIILFMLLNSLTGLVIPYLMGTVLFDQALGGTGRFAGQIALVIGLIILFRTLSLLFGVLFGVINAKMAAKVAFDLKASVFSAMQRLSLSFFQKKQTGQLMTRVNNDATELQYFFVDGIPYFIVNAMNIIGITTILLVMDWKLALLCFIPLPIVVVIIRKVFPKLWRLSWRRWRRVSRMNSIISDTLRGTRVVKAFGKEQQEIARFRHASDAFSDVEQRFGKLSSTVFPVLNALTQLSAIGIWAFGGWKVLQGELTFGVIVTFINYLFMLFGPIQFMNNIIHWWSHCMTAAQRIFEIQDAVADVREKPDAVHLDTIRGRVDVEQVTFAYEPNKPVLKQVSMRAEPGQMIGVVGHSGAGKSTLVNLISRLYDVEEGAIRVDGIDVRDMTTATLRKHIGIVSQEVYVFMGTIAENIAYADPDCTLADIIHAAKIANAHDFIEKLPDGYDTIVGTGGYSLSGGEKQRISIARAILHNPKILILDEATASLDTETELQIQEALESLMRGRTTFAIAHRLSTLRNADVLIVMEHGRVVESGTHEQLMAQNGMYADLVRKHDEALKMRGAV